MTVYDKKNRKSILVEVTEHINDKNEYKKRKYLDPRLGLRNLYPDYEIEQINMVFKVAQPSFNTFKKPCC